MSVRLLPAVVLAMALGASAAQIDSTVLSVTIRPAVSMSMDGLAVGVKIRLAPETTALVWRSADCGLMPAAGYSITRSGTFSIPFDAIAGQGGHVCLASSDGALVSSALIPEGETAR